MSFLNQVETFFKSGSPLSWLASLAIVLGLTFLIKAILVFIFAKLEKLTAHTHVMWDNLILESLKSTKSWAIFAALLIPMVSLMSNHAETHKGVIGFSTILISIQVIIWGIVGIRYWRKNYLQKRVAKDAASAEALGLIATIFQALFIVIVILVSLTNLGVNVSALLAGLGIGGIAIALAAQNVLGDLFGSLSIVLDRPFVIGDSILVGDKSGTVEDIGLKTTRLRATSGELLIISNKDLLESRVHNYKKLQRRRVEKNLFVAHGTDVDKLKRIPDWIKNFISKKEKLRIDRCALEDITETSYVYKIVYFVEDPDYNLYAKMQEELYLDILNKFKSEDIQLTRPVTAVVPPVDSKVEKK